MVQGDFPIVPSLPCTVRYQNDKRPMSQLEALFDEGFHGKAALVCSLGYCILGGNRSFCALFSFAITCVW